MPIYIQIAVIVVIYIGLIWGFAKVSNLDSAQETEWPEMQVKIQPKNKDQK